MRGGVVLCLALTLSGCADAITPTNRPKVSVAGLVSNGMGQPVSNASVAVRTWAPNACGTGTVLQGVTGTTNNNGIYRLDLIVPATGYSACIRVTADSTTSVDTTVVNLPTFKTVQINLTVP
jgi:hypothetical protein